MSATEIKTFFGDLQKICAFGNGFSPSLIPLFSKENREDVSKPLIHISEFLNLNENVIRRSPVLSDRLARLMEDSGLGRFISRSGNLKSVSRDLLHYLNGDNVFKINFYQLAGIKKNETCVGKETLRAVFAFLRYKKLLQTKDPRTITAQDIRGNVMLNAPSELEKRLMARPLSHFDIDTFYKKFSVMGDLKEINLPALRSLLNRIKKIPFKKGTYEDGYLSNIFYLINHRLNDSKHPLEASQIIKVLVTGLINMQNQKPKEFNLKLSESNLKKDLIKNYENPGEKDQAMSDLEGRISSIMVNLEQHGGRTVAYSILQMLRYKKNDQNFRLYVFGKHDYLKKLLINEPELAKKVIYINDPYGARMPFNHPWMRDGARRTRYSIIEPHEWRQNGEQVYDLLALYDHSRIRQGNVIFDGGNIRVDKDHVFIGASCISGTIQLIQKEMKFKNLNYTEMAINRFQLLFNKKVIVIGGKWTKGELDSGQNHNTYHIDLFLTFAGDRKALLAQKLSKKDLLYLSAQKSPEMPQTKKGDKEPGDLVHAQQELKKARYQFSRLPYVWTHLQIAGEGEIYQQIILSYNNCMTETVRNTKGKDQKIVYMPYYYYRNPGDYLINLKGGEKIDLRKINDMAVNIYRKQGFIVCPIPYDAHYTGIVSGSFNCSCFEKKEYN